MPYVEGMRRFRAAACLLAILPAAGCVGRRPLPSTVTAPAPQPAPARDLRSHLLGVWEKRGGRLQQMAFLPDGELRFKGGLEFYNPGRWALDPGEQELRITLPEADVDKLQVFQLYVHDGVKAFHPALKEIIYHFDEQTWDLNVGGWTYSKTDSTPSPASAEPEAEPVLK